MSAAWKEAAAKDAAAFDAVCAEQQLPAGVRGRPRAPRVPPPMPRQPRSRTAGELALMRDLRSGALPLTDVTPNVRSLLRKEAS